MEASMLVASDEATCVGGSIPVRVASVLCSLQAGMARARYLGLRHCKTGAGLAFQQRDQPAGLLCLGAISHQDLHVPRVRGRAVEYLERQGALGDAQATLRGSTLHPGPPPQLKGPPSLEIESQTLRLSSDPLSKRKDTEAHMPPPLWAALP